MEDHREAMHLEVTADLHARKSPFAELYDAE